MKRFFLLTCLLIPAALLADEPRGYVPPPPASVSSVDSINEDNLPKQLVNTKADLGDGNKLVFDRVHKNLKLKIMDKKVTSDTVTVKVGMTGSLC